ncbi:caspase family protein [Komagataeibacter nataicola]|uniref:caspase family protein n=1 Tax=Komagataeibacter nataicola TaxID=265960 RepID=UPI0038D1062A
MNKAAVVVGINNYDHFTCLSGCENDANAMEKLLTKNHDGSPNFNCRKLLSSEMRVTRSVASGTIRRTV